VAGRIAFTPTEADVVAATREWMRRSLLQPRTRLAFFGTAMAAALVGAGLALQAGAPAGRAGWVASAAALGGLLLVGLILALRLALAPHAARRGFRRNAAMQGEQVFSWSEEGIGTEMAGERAGVGWNALHRWGEWPGGFLFAAPAGGLWFVPRHALSLDEAADLAATARRCGPARL